MITLEQRLKLDKQKERREEIAKAISRILTMKSGPERWRASIALVLNLNPISEDGKTAKESYMEVVEANKELRLDQANKFATNKSESMRFGLSAPAWFMTQIEAFDKMAFDSGNPDCKKNFRKLCKEFPEFQIAEKM